MYPPPGRRPPLFGAGPQVDPESLERENDRGIDALGDRVGALRQMTLGIHSEVEGQHRLLDGMSDSMSIAQAGLANAAVRFRRVFETPRGRQSVASAAGAAAFLFLIMLLLRR